MRKYVQHLEITWKKALDKVRAEDGGKEDHSWIDGLLCFHLGTYAPLNKSDLKGYLIRLARIFKYYALQQPEFVSLSKEDQKRLLNFNAPVFIQYILTRYLNAKDPIEQLKWLTLETDFDEKTRQMLLHRISLDTFANRLDLFKDEAKGKIAKWEYEAMLGEDVRL